MRTPWMDSSYKKRDDLNVLVREIEGTKYYVVLRADTGAWVVFDEDGYARYQKNDLNEIEMEALYFRGLALDDSGKEVSISFPEPAEYPSVAIVNITTNCNLRCKYCFVNCGSFVGENMEEAVMQRTIEEMYRMPSKTITFELQGGEPLCNLDGMEKFLEIADRLKQGTDKIVKYRIMTNATLIDDRFIRLAKKYNINMGVSVDGPGDMTNLSRVDANGNGSFDKVDAGIDKLIANDLTPDGAVCTIGQHNCKDSYKIVDYFHSKDIAFKPRPANYSGRELEEHTTTKKGEWFEAYKEMYHRSKNLGAINFSIHIFEENVYGPIRDYICMRYPCGAAREIITVNPDGSVYPCDGFKGNEHFLMGNIKTETLADMIAKPWVQKLRDRTEKDIPKCSKCLFRAMCCSCCYSAYGAFGTVYREDPHCYDRQKIFLFLIDEWIRQNVCKTEAAHS